MKNLEITHQKEFMNSLLNKEQFDDFLLKEALIKTSNTFHIDGLINRDYYDNDEDIIGEEAPYDYIVWSKIKNTIRSLIVGKHVPVSMKITLYFKPDLMKKIIGEGNSAIDYLILNLHFGSKNMSLTTGVAYKEFTLDKDYELRWDKYMSDMLMDY